MKQIFHGIDDHMLIIFDNMVIGANSLAELKSRFAAFVERCIEKNVYLKLSKSWFAVTSVNFFGYVVDKSGFKFDETRLQGIQDYVFPSERTTALQVKAMQRFLGVCNFYRPTYVYAPNPPSQDKDSKNNPLWSD
jgi:hypothetical protein